MKEAKRVSLSSSDGTQMTVLELQQASAWMRKSLTRIREINEGTYMSVCPPIQFDADTSQELLDAVAECFYVARDLADYILHIEIDEE